MLAFVRHLIFEEPEKVVWLEFVLDEAGEVEGAALLHVHLRPRQDGGRRTYTTKVEGAALLHVHLRPRQDGGRRTYTNKD